MGTSLDRESVRLWFEKDVQKIITEATGHPDVQVKIREGDTLYTIYVEAGLYYKKCDRLVPVCSFGLQALNAVPVLYSNSVYVRDPFQKLGIGERLLKLRNKTAKALGFDAILAAVSKTNRTEIHLLEKDGWQKIPSPDGYCSDGWIKWLREDKQPEVN